MIPALETWIGDHTEIFSPVLCAGLLSTRIQIDRTVQRLIRSQPDRFVIDGNGPHARVGLRHRFPQSVDVASMDSEFTLANKPI